MVGRERIVCLIPARIGSTRFPRKPLAEIHGKPMIVWVMERAVSVFGRENTFCVTDSSEILETLSSFGYESILEAGEHRTGTDRVAAAAQKFSGVDRFFNIQGDEPALETAVIKRFVEQSLSTGAAVTNAYSEKFDDERLTSSHSIKMVTARDGRLLYASRNPIPHSQNFEQARSSSFQVCIYSFTPASLKAFSDSRPPQGGVEIMENIEILRFLELGIRVDMFSCETSSHPVDVPSDVRIVEQILDKQRIDSGSE